MNKTATYSMPPKTNLLDTHKELGYIEAHLIKALNAAFKGKCLKKGAAHIECALAILMDLKDKDESK